MKELSRKEVNALQRTSNDRNEEQKAKPEGGKVNPRRKEGTNSTKQ